MIVNKIQVVDFFAGNAFVCLPLVSNTRQCTNSPSGVGKLLHFQIPFAHTSASNSAYSVERQVSKWLPRTGTADNWRITSFSGTLTDTSDYTNRQPDSLRNSTFYTADFNFVTFPFYLFLVS